MNLPSALASERAAWWRSLPIEHDSRPRAIDLLNAALSRPTIYGAVYFDNDPAFASLRENPDIRDTLERHRCRGEVPPTLRPLQ